ncbi:MAG: pilus assembly protein [Acidocella sp.]|nr:pilus assembly protein [Acidocella sp.]
MMLPGFCKKLVSRRAVAAVEFAIIVPVLIILFIGTIEVLTLYRTEAKLNAVAFNVAQTVSVAQSVGTANPPIANLPANTSFPEESVTSLNDLCQGAVLGMAPFPAGGMTLSIASITEEKSPQGVPTTAPVYSANTTTYDKWEADSTVSASGTCSTKAGTALLSGTGPGAPIVIATPPAATSAISVPCDNVIIVQASVVYAGLTGLIARSRPTLTQTSYVRWRYAAPTTELRCTGCTLQNATVQVCNQTNTTSQN